MIEPLRDELRVDFRYSQVKSKRNYAATIIGVDLGAQHR
jgi:hypothetical protein